MLKKMTALFLAFGLLFSVAAPLIDTADAKRYRSPSRSYEQPPRNNVQEPQRTDRVNDGATTQRPGVTTPGATRTGGFFSGGMMRGLFLGGMAGLLFGGLLANFGMLGSLLGLAINLLALFVLFILIRKVVVYFMNKRRDEGRYPR